MKKIYIAGSMSEHKDVDWNVGAFDRATLFLRAKGYTVISPAEVDLAIWGFDGRQDRELPDGMTRRKVLAIDLGVLLPMCDAIYMLTGWSHSRGAWAEFTTAETIGLEIMFEAGAERGTVGYIAPKGD